MFFGHAFQHVGDNLIDRRLRGHGSRRGLAEQPEALAAAVVRVADGGVRRDQLAEQPLESPPTFLRSPYGKGVSDPRSAARRASRGAA